jgi:hypothetical protein
LLALDNHAVPDSVNGVVTRAKQGVITAALSTLSKVEETALRRVAIDRMPDILRRVAEVEASLPPMRRVVDLPAVDISSTGS